jgi:hypothetical protein
VLFSSAAAATKVVGKEGFVAALHRWTGMDFDAARIADLQLRRSQGPLTYVSYLDWMLLENRVLGQSHDTAFAHLELHRDGIVTALQDQALEEQCTPSTAGSLATTTISAGSTSATVQTSSSIFRRLARLLCCRPNSKGKRSSKSITMTVLPGPFALSPGYALARQWAGFEQESEMLRKEIPQLRGLISSSAYDLKAAGEEGKSRRLLRALEGR